LAPAAEVTTLIAKQGSGDPGTGERGGAASFALQLDASGRPLFSLWNGVQTARIEAPAGLANGSWHYLAATRGGGSMSLYVDGALVATGLINGNITYATTPGFDVELGAYLTLGTSRGLDGLIDEVTIYERALSGSEIQDIYNSGSAGYCLP
jgi:hypothetical protein